MRIIKSKLILVIMMLCICSTTCFSQVPAGQKDEEKTPEIFTIVEEMPEYPGGMSVMTKKIKEQVKLPQQCLVIDSTFKCKTFVKFVVDEKGKCYNPVILKSCPGCAESDQLVIKFINEMPLWRPGKMQGKPVKCYYQVPFTLSK